MRKLRLLTAMMTPAGEIPAGDEITVDAAEAARLLAARGLVEDLGEAAESSRAATEDAPPSSDGAATGGEGETLAATNADGARAVSSGATSPEAGSGTGGEGEPLAATYPEAEVAASNSDQANGADAPAQEADAPAAASASAPRPRRKG